MTKGMESRWSREARPHIVLASSCEENCERLGREPSRSLVTKSKDSLSEHSSLAKAQTVLESSMSWAGQDRARSGELGDINKGLVNRKGSGRSHLEVAKYLGALFHDLID